MISLKEKYIKEIRPRLKSELGLKNEMAAPRILKVTVSTGIGRFLKDEKSREEVLHNLTIITGQKPKACQAKKSIATFKTRTGLVIGYQVTMRGQRMFDFLTRFINIVLPRTRDFRGLELKSIDKNGHLNIGIKEHLAFPEIAQEHVKTIFGLGITVTTDAKDRRSGEALFKAMGFPFKPRH